MRILSNHHLQILAHANVQFVLSISIFLFAFWFITYLVLLFVEFYSGGRGYWWFANYSFKIRELIFISRGINFGGFGTLSVADMYRFGLWRWSLRQFPLFLTLLSIVILQSGISDPQDSWVYQVRSVVFISWIDYCLNIPPSDNRCLTSQRIIQGLFGGIPAGKRAAWVGGGGVLY